MIVFVTYRSPSQNSNQSELFLSNLENLLSDINKRKPSLYVVTGDLKRNLLHGVMTETQ